ncbi:MAG: type IX secretion system outer membrane channel protein PorV [Bacteroidales bacterium]|nr:type IX secretion system outer membrane channel protein PorV [Bacteroidales bacterium]
MTRIKSFLVLLCLVMAGFAVSAQGGNSGEVQGRIGQTGNVISTAVPFMIIAPDARAAGMGDVGVSTSPDVYSMYWNAGKYAFLEDDFSVGLAYSPWLRKLVSDMNIAYLGVAKRVSPMSTVAMSLRYFSLGDINFTDEDNHSLGTYSPNEFAIDACYSRKLGDYISGAIAARFIYSDLTQGIVNYSKPAYSVAADLGVYYQRPVNWFRNMAADFNWGVAITNIGSKMAYSDANTKKDFIPTNLRFGATMNMHLDDYNELAVSIDLNKLLVPTPPIYYKTADGRDSIGVDNKPVIYKGKDNDVSMVAGIFQSFYDAPDGFSEELKEFTIGIGLEYWYDKVFSARAGFFHEDKTKGNRRYLTFGAGIRYNIFELDISYLVPVNNTSNSGVNPLENTLRFDLVFNINKWKKDSTKLERTKERN